MPNTQEQEDRKRFDIPEDFTGPTHMPNGTRFYTFMSSTIRIKPDGKCEETFEAYNDFEGHHFVTCEIVG